MKLTSLLAKHLRDVHFGGNWTSVNMKDTLAGVTWKQANTQIYTLNTIVKLVFHIHYYIHVVSEVLSGKPFNAHDQFAFASPPIDSEEDWHDFLDTIWSETEVFAKQIEQLPDSKLDEVFQQEKYGTYYRNIQGIIEHTHYHLGQIMLIKKLLQAQADSESPS